MQAGRELDALRSETDEYKAPKHESFHFGLKHCAYCLGWVERRKSISRVIKSPQYGDKAETEVLIPSGRHLFHRSCFEEIKNRRPK